MPDNISNFKYNGLNRPGKYFFYSTVFWGVKSGKGEKLNGLDKLENSGQASWSTPGVFAYSLLLLG